MDCGFDFHDAPECCDFHHREGEIKKDVVGQILQSSVGAFMKEIEKCDPLCANCHRKRHKDLYAHMKVV